MTMTKSNQGDAYRKGYAAGYSYNPSAPNPYEDMTDITEYERGLSDGVLRRDSDDRDQMQGGPSPFPSGDVMIAAIVVIIVAVGLWLFC